jgi:hypothetical protein
MHLNKNERDKIQISKLPNASFLFVTRNRCPNSDFKKNPLTWAFETLLANPLSFKITDWVVICDGSHDHTKQNMNWLSKKHNIVIRTRYYVKRKGCSYRRSQGIKLLTNDLFFMGDDDCLYREDFIGGSLAAWYDLSRNDSRIAVLAQPVLEMRTAFDGMIQRSEIGQIDLKKAWFYHNFDKVALLGEKLVKKPFRIQIFKGVTLGSKSAFLAAGNFFDLSSWDNDYSEHLEMSHQLNQVGNTMYYLPNICMSATHIQWGADHKILSKLDRSTIFSGMTQTLAEIETASRQSVPSGCRISSKNFIINRIGSLLSFYIKVSPASAFKYAIMEYKSAVNNKQIIGTPSDIAQLSIKQRLTLWKKGVRAALVNAQNSTNFSGRSWYNNLMKKLNLPL